VVGVAYFFFRIIGKYLGAYAGCAITGMPVSMKRYIGLALIPQAGVAIGLAFLGQRLLPPEIGNLMLTIILSSSVLYELIGPACAKMSFFLSGTIKTEDREKVEKYKSKEAA
jgi:Kef-type K+ transport system membrane component KefB